MMVMVMVSQEAGLGRAGRVMVMVTRAGVATAAKTGGMDGCHLGDLGLVRPCHPRGSWNVVWMSRLLFLKYRYQGEEVHAKT